jgi:hypothetical protein
MLILLLYSILAAGYKLDDPLSSVLDDEVWQKKVLDACRG